MEEHDCRSTFCRTPLACRIRGVDKRAKRRSERCILFTHAGRIRSLCTRTVYNAVPGSRCALRSGTHVQANAGKRSHRPSPSRLLAATPFWTTLLNNREEENRTVQQSTRHNTTPPSGKDPVACSFRRRLHRHVYPAKTRVWCDPAVATPLAGAKRVRELRDLRVENVMADRPRRFLSSSE